MELIEIIVILACVIIVGGVLFRYIYRVINKLPTGDCACCANTKKGSKLVKQYRKKYKSNK